MLSVRETLKAYVGGGGVARCAGRTSATKSERRGTGVSWWVVPSRHRRALVLSQDQPFITNYGALQLRAPMK